MTTTALITGGTSGIGRAVARKLADLGIHVIVVGRNAERGEKTIAEIRTAGGQADFISSDLRDASSAREVAKRAIELGNGHVDILINNAGIYPFGPTHETSEDLFDKVYSLNVKVPYFLVAELAPLMAKRGKGAIVNLSTMVADYGASGMSLYGSSKAAINLLTKAWTAEYGPSGVRINAVSPGPTRTEGMPSAKVLSDSPLKHQRGDRPRPTRSPKPSCFSRQIVLASFRARNSPWMEAEPQSNSAREGHDPSQNWPFS
jgi:NAD(P)-dependent dehydrogenase (short-subunit alcohol dehydrogenase family)